MNGNTWTDPNSGVPFITKTSREDDKGEDEETSQTAVKLSRITIATAASGNGETQAPQWVVDALKVGLVHVGLSLGTQ